MKKRKKAKSVKFKDLLCLWEHIDTNERDHFIECLLSRTDSHGKILDENDVDLLENHCDYNTPLEDSLLIKAASNPKCQHIWAVAYRAIGKDVTT